MGVGTPRGAAHTLGRSRAAAGSVAPLVPPARNRCSPANARHPPTGGARHQCARTCAVPGRTVADRTSIAMAAPKPVLVVHARRRLATTEVRRAFRGRLAQDGLPREPAAMRGEHLSVAPLARGTARQARALVDRRSRVLVRRLAVSSARGRLEVLGAADRGILPAHHTPTTNLRGRQTTTTVDTAGPARHTRLRHATLPEVAHRFPRRGARNANPRPSAAPQPLPTANLALPAVRRVVAEQDPGDRIAGERPLAGLDVRPQEARQVSGRRPTRQRRRSGHSGSVGQRLSRGASVGSRPLRTAHFRGRVARTRAATSHPLCGRVDGRLCGHRFRARSPGPHDHGPLGRGPRCPASSDQDQGDDPAR